MLQRRGRVIYRALKLRFRLDDDHLEALKDELHYAHPHVVEDDGRGLIWTGATRPTPTPGSPTEGFDTADLQAAKALLEELA